jgi:hypothetical protein
MVMICEIVHEYARTRRLIRHVHRAPRGNCLITRDQLPRLLALLDALEQRRQEMPLSAWWRRYGPTWAAIRHQVLPEFSPAEVKAAEAVGNSALGRSPQSRPIPRST